MLNHLTVDSKKMVVLGIFKHVKCRLVYEGIPKHFSGLIYMLYANLFMYMNYLLICCCINYNANYFVRCLSGQIPVGSVQENGPICRT